MEVLVDRRTGTVFVLCYRQAVGATQSVWNDVIKEHWMFMKEISSDGDVSTVSAQTEITQ